MADPTATDPTPFSWLMPLIGPVISAAIGIFMRHASNAASGSPFSFRRLAFEIPSVLGLGIMGGALGSWLGVPEEVRWGIAAVMGYKGTQGIDVFIGNYMKSKFRE